MERRREEPLGIGLDDLLRAPLCSRRGSSKTYARRCIAGTRGNARLTMSQVKEIKYGVELAAVLATRLGVTQQCVSKIRRGRTWKEI